MKLRSAARILILLAVAAAAVRPTPAAGQRSSDSLPSSDPTSEPYTAPPLHDTSTAAVLAPAEYLGYPVGADFRLASWDSITGYLNLLADRAPGVRVDTIGRSTLGRPFVLVTLTAPENMARLDDIRANQARLADPRGLTDAELDRLIERQPAVVLIAHNIHSTEIASSQGAMELAHALGTDPSLVRSLRDLVVLLVPSVNPDGQEMVVDWYRRVVGTPYEGSGMPYLYHHYVGHDNNRDWFMLTQAETRLLTDVLYRQWYPEIVYDVHQMGNDGARFFIPPFDDPVNPNLDPLLVRMISYFGLRVAADLEMAGRAGVVTGDTYDLWWHGGLRSVPARHNMVGILSETASARLASPIFQEAADLTDAPEFAVDYPNPWPGGWWRMRDILDYQAIAATSIIDLAARHREWLIERFVELGRRAVEAGLTQPPYAFLVPPDQTDPGSAARMLEILRLGGIEIHRATAPFTAEDRPYPEGTRVVLMAQPYRAHAKDLLERQHYPDLRQYPNGPPDAPYDVTGWTLPLQMGVRVIRVERAFEAPLELELGPVRPAPGTVRGEGPAFLLDPAMNAANLAVQRALQAGADAFALAEPLESRGRTWPIGTPILRGGPVPDILERLARDEGLIAEAARGTVSARRIAAPRVALYQPWTASMDEGWTRWVFETWDVPYETVHSSRIRQGELSADFDVLVLPDVSADTILNGRVPGTLPSEYTGGVGREGLEAIHEFVESGGTLICLDGSSAFAIDQFRLPVRDVRPAESEQKAGRAFYAPGSILRVVLERGHPITYGMPEETAIYYANSRIFAVADRAEGVTVLARYPAAGQLLSGYALHVEEIAGRAALVEVEVDDGRVILFGFRPQHRGQPQETFKLLFNAIYRAGLGDPVALPL